MRFVPDFPDSIASGEDGLMAPRQPAALPPTSLSPDARDADCCIVGAGPAGLTLATELTRSGQQVVVVESGGRRSSSRDQRLNDGEVVGVAYDGLVATRHRGVGGTTALWNTSVHGQPGAKFVPLDPIDMVHWPLSWDELAEHYPRAQTICGLGPFDYRPERWTSGIHRPFTLEGTGLTNRVYQLGTADRFLRVLPAELEATPGCTLLTSTTVVGLEFDAPGRSVTGVRAVTGAGRAVTVRSRHVVLACGAVENARLLLAAAGPLVGLAWLGRGFMEHPRDEAIAVVRDEPTEATFYRMRTAQDGTAVIGRLALTEDAIRSFRLPNASLSVMPPARRDRPGFPKWAARLSRLLYHPSGRQPAAGRLVPPNEAHRAFSLAMHLEQRPSRANRIELGQPMDQYGNRLPRLHLCWTDQEQRELEQLRHRVAGWLREASLGEVYVAPGGRPDLNAHHHAGTTRFGDHAGNGVVDRDARVFGIDNLYLAGASVFPTAGFANPMLTIVALAIRLGRHLSGR